MLAIDEFLAYIDHSISCDSYFYRGQSPDLTFFYIINVVSSHTELISHTLPWGKVQFNLHKVIFRDCLKFFYFTLDVFYIFT